jgi:hypothetical protein
MSGRTEVRQPVIPRALSRLEAATYVGIGGTLFDEMVATGKPPKPFRIRGRVLWDRYRLDVAIDELHNEGAADERWRDVG